MEKISAQDAHAVLSEVSSTLRAQNDRIQTLEGENSELKEKLAGFMTRDRVEKIAAKMEERNIEAGLSFDQKVDMLMEKAGEGSLDVVEQAVMMTAADGSLGSLGDRPSAGSGDPLTSYLTEEL